MKTQDASIRGRTSIFDLSCCLSWNSGNFSELEMRAPGAVRHRWRVRGVLLEMTSLRLWTLNLTSANHCSALTTRATVGVREVASPRDALKERRIGLFGSTAVLFIRVSTDALLQSGTLIHDPPTRIESMDPFDRWREILSANGLGIFDTAPNPKEIRLGIAVIALQIGAFVLILPFRNVPLGQVNSFVPTIDAIMFVGEMITAALLYAQGTLFQSGALFALATGYLVAALLLVPHALTFPGAFSANGLLGGDVNTTAWIATFQRLAFPIAIISYVLLRSTVRVPRLDRSLSLLEIARWILVGIAVASALTLLATFGHPLLPSFYVNHVTLVYENALAYQAVSFAFLTLAAVLLIRQRSSVLDLWLLVAVSGWLLQSALIMTLHARFTAGFYGLFGFVLASHLIVLIALVAESNRLYARLALSTAVQEMEREARLTSMEAVASAIAYEIGQPLAAISINAGLGERLLTQAPPNAQMTVKLLLAISDSVQRSFDVMKAVRAMFASESELKIEFNLNDLLRETVTILDRELMGSKTCLKVALAEAIPPVFANRVQLQQVLVNLIKNAIASSIPDAENSRSIVVRSKLQTEAILIEVGDSNARDTPEEVPGVFDALQNNKAGSDRLGLSLCRTIVEEHGGRIWASRASGSGMVYHVRLSRHSTIARQFAPN